jgi:hypothetical protein
MKIAAHIPFYNVESRLVFLRKVLDKLNTIPEELTIFIYTNKAIPAELLKDNIVVYEYPYKPQKWIKFLSNFDFPFLRKFIYPISRATNQYLYQFFECLSLKKYLHPFYLTWEHRKIVEKNLDNFDVQLYLEDDMGFGAEAFEYWKKYVRITDKHTWNLGFLRTEFNNDNQTFITDLTAIPENIIELEGQKFLINDNNPYYALWIYSKEELRKFIKSKEWKFNFRGINLREKAAYGRHAPSMKRYKGTLLPLIEKDNQLIVDAFCAIDHFPNNYIGDQTYCKLTFPLAVKKTN